jgi:antitoxin component of RelBE/YafQ-DinJ toxin-antitoxin module
MPSAVVSGRVDANVKEQVDRILERAGKTPADVIRDVWLDIYATGELPELRRQEDASEEQRAKYQDFLSFVDSLPAAPDWATELTDARMNDLIASRYV